MSLSLRIAEAVLELEPASRRVELGVDEPMQAFRCSGARPDMKFRVERKDLSGARPGKLLFDSGALWRLYGDKNEFELRMTSPALGPVPYKVARFDSKFSRGTIQIHSGYPSYFPEGTVVAPLEYPLGELIYLHWLGQGRGIEVHSCGLVDANGDGILLVGHSGAGKTTSAEQWLKHPGVEVLSDDRIILRKEGRQVFMYGTPWHGTGYLSSPRKAPLKAILFLRHGPKHRIVPTRGPMATSQVMACSFVPLYQRESLAFSVEFLEDVTSSVFCGELEFTPDPSVADFVRAELLKHDRQPARAPAKRARLAPARRAVKPAAKTRAATAKAARTARA